MWREQWGKYRHPIRSKDDLSAAKLGQKYEEQAAHILMQNGFSSTLMPNHHSFDILLGNKIRIDVKHSLFDVSTLDSQKCASPTYSIANTKCGRDCDFFFVFIPDAIFIIPASEVRLLHGIHYHSFC